MLSYLGDFLFSPQRARTPVKALSGGERARLLLAKLFSKPANLLVLDEPTNDLDIETLELLEEVLDSFQGTVLIVSHDRVFLDNVATSTLVFEGNGKVIEYIGGYDDWLRQGGSPKLLGVQDEKQTAVMIETTVQSAKSVVTQEQSTKRKLSYKDQRELDALPAKIEALESELEILQEQVNNPDFYQQSTDVTSVVLEKLTNMQLELDGLLERWSELEG